MEQKLIERFRHKLKDEHFSELIRGASVAFILKILGIILGYLFTLLVTRTFGARVWGIFSVFLVTLQILSIFGRLGMDMVLLKFSAEFLSKGEGRLLKEVYWKILLITFPFSLFLAVIVYIFSPILADKIFHKAYLVDYLRLMSFGITPLIVLFLHAEGIRGLKRIKEYMLLQQVGIFALAIFFFLVGLLFLKNSYLPILSYIFSIFVLSIFSVYLWLRYLYGFVLSLGLDSTSTNISYNKIFSLSIPMLLSGSLSLIIFWTDTLMLGILGNVREVGIYNVALRLSMIVSISLLAINVIVVPKFAEAWGKRDLITLKRMAQQSTGLATFISFPIFLFIFIFSSDLLAVFGQDFVAGKYILILLAFGQLVNVAVGSVGNILLITEHQKVFQKVLFLSFCVNVVLNFIFIPVFGALGAAVASVVSLVLWNVILLLYVRLKLGFWTVSLIK